MMRTNIGTCAYFVEAQTHRFRGAQKARFRVAAAC
jgi:hypothetical protein